MISLGRVVIGVDAVGGVLVLLIVEGAEFESICIGIVLFVLILLLLLFDTGKVALKGSSVVALLLLLLFNGGVGVVVDWEGNTRSNWVNALGTAVVEDELEEEEDPGMDWGVNGILIVFGLLLLLRLLLGIVADAFNVGGINPPDSSGDDDANVVGIYIGDDWVGEAAIGITSFFIGWIKRIRYE